MDAARARAAGKVAPGSRAASSRRMKSRAPRGRTRPGRALLLLPGRRRPAVVHTVPLSARLAGTLGALVQMVRKLTCFGRFTSATEGR
jgi:hypothetical protein